MSLRWHRSLRSWFLSGCSISSMRFFPACFQNASYCASDRAHRIISYIRYSSSSAGRIKDAITVSETNQLLDILLIHDEKLGTEICRSSYRVNGSDTLTNCASAREQNILLGDAVVLVVRCDIRKRKSKNGYTFYALVLGLISKDVLRSCNECCEKTRLCLWYVGGRFFLR